MSPKPERKKPTGVSPLRGRLAPQVEQIRIGDQPGAPMFLAAIPGQAAVSVPAGPDRIDPAAFTGTDAERLEALEGALDQAASRTQAGIDMMKAWLDEQRGTVLREIRDSELYKTKADTFEAYVAERWAMSRPRAYALIDAAPVLRVMSSIEDTKPAVTQALALTRVYERDGEQGVRDVLRETGATAKAEGKKVTAAAIKRTVEARGYGQPATEQRQTGPAPAVEAARVRRSMDGDLKELKDIYDRLGTNGPVFMADDPGQADAWLREYGEFGKRIRNRAEKIAKRAPE